jgi:hypothetical protein
MKHIYRYTSSVYDYRLHWQMDFNTSFLEFDKVEYLQEHVMKQAYQIAHSITFSTSITEGILKLFKHKLHQRFRVILLCKYKYP